MVKDFEEVRKSMGIEQWLTMGHSFGGILQIGYADQYPEVISGMIMINCTLNMTESFSKSWIPKAAEFLNLPPKNIYTNDSIPLLDRLMGIIGQLNSKSLNWKMAFENEENYGIMDATYDEFPNWNYDLGRQGLSIKEYWIDFKPLTSKMKMPVLFFTGDSDWMAGPENYIGVNFPDMILFKSDVGHIPFMENKSDLEKAIDMYINKYHF
jgi:proline iminopeptidase